jgi:high affinity Mn2+ porin
VVYQYHPHYGAAFNGPNSLNPGGMGRETFDATLFAGIRPWQGVEFYVDPELDQGFGLSNTLGVAGFPSGEAYKVGRRNPYYETPRAFGRFTIGLSGAAEKIDDGPNQIAGTRLSNNIVITAGKFGVTDIFDNNRYAHDPRADFLNWSIVDSGAYDYAANAWGYTYGAAAEWNQNWWTIRAGIFALSRVPNEVDLDSSFGQYEFVTEIEERHTLFDHPGKVKLLFFNNRGRMANYNDATRLGQQTGTAPDVSLVRHDSSKPGVGLNIEQQFTDDLGGFLRASLNDGHKESYEFTEINRSLVLGLALSGNRWHRDDDTIGLAGVVNDISKDARNYLAAGGLGILIGDGALPQAGFEKILELYYKAAIVDGFAATVDYQHIENPAYNAVRGPVDIFGFRLHAEF